MQRPDTVPANANWNPEDNQWELGQYNPANEKTGIWQYWYPEGQFWSSTNYNDGTPPFKMVSYHPDGTLSQEGTWNGGRHWIGTYRWIKSENPSPEPFPSGDGKHNPNVWIAEFDYTAIEGVYNAQRYFNKALEPVSVIGAPLPERPANVPPNAHFVDSSIAPDHKSCWVAGQINGFTGKFTGAYDEWDINGTQVVKRIYDATTFEVLEQHKYKDGQLTESIINGPGDQKLTTQYDAGVIRETKLVRNNRQDRTYTFFDETGKQLYAVREEKISDQHKKRYYNDLLVYEGIIATDINEAPVSVKYYHPDGTVMIEYISNGNGSGKWELYEDGLTLALPDEKKYNKKNSWGLFLTHLSDMDADTTETDWELVHAAFIAKHTEMVVKERLNALPVPEFLQQELQKIKWDKVEVAMYGGSSLPMYINGIFAEDEKIVATSSNHIWIEIEHQGSLYEATYRVAYIIARCLPHYRDQAVIYSRLLDLLFSIMALPGIEEDKKLYKPLADALAGIEQDLLDRTADPDDVKAIKVLYLLLHTGKNVADFYQEIWQNAANSIFKRSYVLYTLGEYYLRSKQTEKMISEFSTALENATDQIIRLVLAIHLVTATKKQAAAPWLAELINALADPAPVQNDFNELYPYTGDYDVQEYMLMVLGYAKPAVLMDHILPVIEMLPHVNAMKQETLLNAIGSILFPGASALKKMTPIRKQALLAMAQVMDTDTIFINHTDVLQAYGLPTTTAELKKLAGV